MDYHQTTMGLRSSTFAVWTVLALSLNVFGVDFAKDVRPILSKHCFECHGPHAAVRQARLRLDLDTGFREPRSSGTLIVPGEPDASLLFQRISEHAPSDRMPPESFRNQLSKADIATIRTWIVEGGETARHWAFTTPTRSDTSIDEAVLRRVETAGLQPSPEAAPLTLLRRVTFDLTGLPPTLAEQRRCTDGEETYEASVDRLLNSPAYGERMASRWLDLARYADTQGYQSDIHRHAWPYRDWVVRAYNSNLPYDDFLRWQLAGDLIPNATQDQRLATMFNRLHRQTNEGGSIEAELRAEYVADRVQTFGLVAIGMTTECARCHDHMYDPISHTEFYQLAAFFDNIDESGLLSHFTNAVPTPALTLESTASSDANDATKQTVAKAETTLAALQPARRDAYAAWLLTNNEPRTIPGLRGAYSLDDVASGTLANSHDAANPGHAANGPVACDGVTNSGARMSGDNTLSFPNVGHVTRNDPFTLSLWLKVPATYERSIVLHRSRAWTDAGSQGYEILLEDGRVSWSLIHFWPGNAISIRSNEPLPVGEWTHVVVTSNGSATAAGLQIYLDGEIAPHTVVRDHLTKQITGGGPGHLTLGARFRDRGFKLGEADELRVFDRALTPIEVADLSGRPTLETDEDERLYRYYLETVDEPYLAQHTSLDTARRAVAARENSETRIMTMRELDTPRVTYRLHRGQYNEPREVVEPSTPTHIFPFANGLPPNRLGLAEWTLDRANPLTARVAVNRLWLMVFGEGLLATPDNFGSQSLPPSHPHVLDTLAVDFIDSNWDIKAMLKRMVMSSTYRQRSRASTLARTIDPDNRLLSHASPRRLTAEMLRDQALAASGLLVSTMGGASVFPFEPPALWKEKSGKQYPTSQGDALHRRSLYTYWKRTSPPPSMMIFDAAKRDVCVAKRSSTSTPLQALVLLNDPQFVEATRALAARAASEGGESTTEHISLAFQLCTNRTPTDEELDILLTLHQSEPNAPLETVCAAILNSDCAIMRR